MTLGPGMEPGAHWWKASALFATPTLLPRHNFFGQPRSLEGHAINQSINQSIIKATPKKLRRPEREG